MIFYLDTFRKQKLTTQVYEQIGIEIFSLCNKKHTIKIDVYINNAVFFFQIDLSNNTVIDCFTPQKRLSAHHNFQTVQVAYRKIHLKKQITYTNQFNLKLYESYLSCLSMIPQLYTSRFYCWQRIQLIKIKYFRQNVKHRQFDNLDNLSTEY